MGKELVVIHIPPEKKKIVTVAVVAVLVIVSVSFVRCGSSVDEVATVVGIGQVVAEEIGRRVDKDNAVILALPKLSEQTDRFLLEQLVEFQKALPQQGVKIMATETAAYDPRINSSSLTTQQYEEIAKKYPSARAIVTYGVALFPLRDTMKLRPVNYPPLIAVGISPEEAESLMAAQVVTTAFVYHYTPPGSAEAKTARERFDRRFRVVGL